MHINKHGLGVEKRVLDHIAKDFRFGIKTNQKKKGCLHRL